LRLVLRGKADVDPHPLMTDVVPGDNSDRKAFPGGWYAIGKGAPLLRMNSGTAGREQRRDIRRFGIPGGEFHENREAHDGPGLRLTEAPLSNTDMIIRCAVLPRGSVTIDVAQTFHALFLRF
jgi:hypothetical protein